MKGFVDTNIPISFIFLLNSFHKKSISIFKKYTPIWSVNVKIEFEKVFINKKEELIKFYDDLKKKLKTLGNNELNKKELMNIAKKIIKVPLHGNKNINYLNNFWEYYLDDSYPNIKKILNAIDNLLYDLNNEIYLRNKKMLKNIEITPKRKKKYKQIQKQLKSYGAHNEDIEIFLDAYDYKQNYYKNLDFITFDQTLYNATLKIKDFKNHIKGKYDF